MTKRMIGPFELGEKVGTGGMGIVYRAIYTKTGVACAIKVLSPDANDSAQIQQRFEREIAILKKLQHPHIVRYFGGGKVGNQRFYAMELVTGGSLEGYLRERGKLPWKEALSITRQVALALEHAHAAGVIHRDLKPANLLMTTDNRIKLTDFGIARDTTATALTAAGKTVGTYAYMAPEQIRGKPPVDRRTDLYALGCVLFEMLTGETPYSGDNPGEVLVKHLQDTPVRVTSLAKDCPIVVEDLVFRLLEKEPEDRYYDALALQVALDEVEQKVAQQASLVGQTAGANPTLSATAAGKTTAVAKKKKKAKRDSGPVYEQTWFLALCLAGLAAIVVWAMQPPSEAQLIDRARKLMASDDQTVWLEARDKALQPLLQRFPQGKHAAEAQDLLDKVEMYYAVEQARNRGVRPPKTEGERLLINADQIERWGDRVSALERYDGMIDLLKDQPSERIYVLIAEQQSRQIRAAGGDKLDRVQFVEDALRRADELAARKNILEARNIWNSIVTFYKDNQELEPHVNQAKERLQRKPSAKPETEPAPAVAPEANPPAANSSAADLPASE